MLGLCFGPAFSSYASYGCVLPDASRTYQCAAAYAAWWSGVVLLLCCRYYGLSPKEEAAHLRHVKRYAKGLFHNIRGDTDR
jgi:hypothetical protein